MKKIIFILLSIIIGATVSNAQTPDWSIALSGKNGFGQAVCVNDNNGDVYVTGYFSNKLDLGTTTLSAIGSVDMFLAKYNASGALQWAKNFGGTTSSTMAHGIVSNKSGELYISGRFTNTIQFGTVSLSSNGKIDVFVVKSDANGNILWGKSGGGEGDDFCYQQGIAIDGLGNVILAGEAKSQNVVFGTNTFKGPIYIAKLSSSGNILWARGAKANVAFNAGLLDVVCDKNSNIYLTGFYGDTLDFNGVALHKSGNSFVYVAKLDVLGNILWAKDGEGTIGLALTCDKDMNVYVAGECTNGNLVFSTITSTGSSNSNLFLTKYDSTGVAKWVKRAGGNLSCVVEDMTTDSTNNIYISGSFSDSIIFENKKLYIPGSAYIAKYTSNGDILWAKNAGSKATSAIKSVYIDKNNNAYTTGYYSCFPNDSSGVFGSLSVYGKSGNSDNMFWAKLSKPTDVLALNTEEGTVNVYPNPVKEYVIVKGIAKGVVIQINDVVGRHIKTIISNADIQEINTSDLLQGNYIVIIDVKGQKTSYHKITKL